MLFGSVLTSSYWALSTLDKEVYPSTYGFSAMFAAVGTILGLIWIVFETIEVLDNQ